MEKLEYLVKFQSFTTTKIYFEHEAGLEICLEPEHQQRTGSSNTVSISAFVNLIDTDRKFQMKSSTDML